MPMWCEKYDSGVSPRKGPMNHGMILFIRSCSRRKNRRCAVKCIIRMNVGRYHSITAQ
jgi:hypothetical protein